MLKKRLIPILLLKNGLLIRSELFKIHQIIGNPIHEVQRFNEWNVDELIYLDISRDDQYDLRRDDHKIKGLTNPLDILDEVSKTCFMPLTWGGRIRTVEDMRQRISRGADKITLNTAAVRSPDLITQGATIFGSQAIVVSIDVLRHPDGQTEVFIDGGQEPTGKKPEEWAREVEQRGAGEILLNSIDRDGTGKGYDLDLINTVAAATTIPVIACGGVGRYEHYAEGIRAGAAAVAAANIWHFKELSDKGGKRALAKAGVDIRL
ncbi:imidazole glycerol phosphate synthase subunit HisF [Oscillatoria sp. FACHB-1407]|uniref:imidazole glycerol phosphate synthase subunit HisF n=1 Tax=Oscillatoria sp. FACHB-1407 TaxID=2692847 RepID=UPI0016879368|nr:imidazole glycerol phosphate synthase cyclase subunit [Oscillatoria sp. FACHB-1407]MBD2464240.1 imidazole glycerol phosphate synthase subunit HisF [Oscillatoria sp. FACHB-1407]